MNRQIPVQDFNWFRRLLGVAMLLVAVVTCHVAIGESTSSSDLTILRTLLSQKEADIDLAQAKLIIDKMIDPDIDIPTQLARLNEMTTALREMVPLIAADHAKLDALRRFIYTPGPWNQHRAFSYDLTDPFGHILRNELLSTYLETREGNCVSMPVLFVVLGQRIGLDLSLATAPEHLFVKYRDASGALFNLETTSGAGVARDVWIRKQMPMTDEAIRKGIYMRPLNKREAVVAMAGVLLTRYRIEGLNDKRIELAKLLHEAAPRNIRSILSLRDALVYKRNTEFVARYPTPNDIPFSKRRQFLELERQAVYWERKARSLGWKAPDEFEG